MPVPAVTHFYADWTFWSTAIALSAFVVSVSPHVVKWLKPRRLELEVFETLALTHKIGNSNAQMQCVIRNTGGRDIKISQLTVTATRDGQRLSTLPARNYLQAPNDVNALLFVPFTLVPGESWSHIVNFFRNFDREEDKRYRDLEYALRDEIHRIILTRPVPQQIAAEADASFVTPLLQMFERKFEWLPGQYEIELAIQATPLKTAPLQRYRFTLFESDTEELRKLAEDYKLGSGVYYPNTSRRIWVFPAMTRV